MEIKWTKFIPKKSSWMIMLLIGILLVVIAIPTNTGSANSSFDYQDKTNMEQRLESLLLQMKGVGEVHAMITYQDEEKVEGIVIIAQGGGNAVIVRNITEVVQALFDVDSHKIRVIEKKQNH